MFFRRLLPCLLLVFAAAGAQVKSSPAAAAHKAVSPQETADLNALDKAFNDPTTLPSDFSSQITQFELKYPKSAYSVPVLMLGLRYSRAHADYLRMLKYGSEILGLAPGNLYAASTLGEVIPENVKATDLDRDDMLAKAEAYDNAVIKTAAVLVPAPGGMTFQGEHFKQAQVKILRDNLDGGAYVSLGRIAALRGQYVAAVANFRQALAYEYTPGDQAQVYFEIGQAEAGAQNAAAAEVAFDQALKLNPSSSFLKQMVANARAKLKPGS